MANELTEFDVRVLLDLPDPDARPYPENHFTYGFPNPTDALDSLYVLEALGLARMTTSLQDLAQMGEPHEWRLSHAGAAFVGAYRFHQFSATTSFDTTTQ